jgi:hypothetical protein
MGKRLKSFCAWIWAFLKDYVPWTAADQFFDSKWGIRFLGFLGGAVVTATGTAVSFIAGLGPVWRFGFLGGLVTTSIVALLILFFSGPSSDENPIPSLQTDVRYVSGEKGFLDLMANLRNAEKVYVGMLKNIGQIHSSLTAQIKRSTVVIARIRARSGNDMFVEIHKETLRIAMRLTNAAIEIEKCLPPLIESVSVYFDTQRELVSEPNSADLNQIAESVRKVRSANALGRESQKLYRQALEDAGGSSQGLDLAFDQMTEEVLKIISIMDDVEARCSTIIDAIESSKPLLSPHSDES